MLQKLEYPIPIASCRTSSIISFYDLSNKVISFNDGDKIEDIRKYVIERELNCGIRVKVRNDRYFIFDFKDAVHAAPLHIKDHTEIHTKVEDAKIIKNERVEFLNAFLACLISQEAKSKRGSPPFNLFGVNNYILCRREQQEIEDLIGKADLNYWSSYAYFLATKFSIENRQLPKEDMDDLEIINSALDLIDQIASNDDPKWFYSLGLLYRSNTYYRHGLNIDAAAFARTVYERLARKEYPSTKDPYTELNIKYNMDGSALEELRKLRHSALHELEFPPSQTSNGNALGRGIADVITLYAKCAKLDLHLPTISQDAEWFDN